MPASPAVIVRPYQPTDVESWLRCRVLAFLHTCYYDDVHPERETFDHPSIELVAVAGSEVIGLIDVELFGQTATIDCLAVHPDHQRRGVAGALLGSALEALPNEVATLDAWTREDEPALRWYAGHGFTERSAYLHVHKRWDESADGFTAPSPLRPPVLAFYQADRQHEQELRARFRRVYVCRQLVRVI